MKIKVIPDLRYTTIQKCGVSCDIYEKILKNYIMLATKILK